MEMPPANAVTRLLRHCSNGNATGVEELIPQNRSHFFTGAAQIDQAAEVLAGSSTTVMREGRTAKARVYRELQGSA
jgi:hypothetical protein